jgi:hypothetical protein
LVSVRIAVLIACILPFPLPLDLVLPFLEADDDDGERGLLDRAFSFLSAPFIKLSLGLEE